MKMKPPLAANTMKTKFMHIQKWWKEAYGKKLFVAWFPGEVEQTRPHQAYAEPDIKQLVEELRFQPLRDPEAKRKAKAQLNKGKFAVAMLSGTSD